MPTRKFLRWIFDAKYRRWDSLVQSLLRAGCCCLTRHSFYMVHQHAKDSFEKGRSWAQSPAGTPKSMWRPRTRTRTKMLLPPGQHLFFPYPSRSYQAVGPRLWIRTCTNFKVLTVRWSPPISLIGFLVDGETTLSAHLIWKCSTMNTSARQW